MGSINPFEILLWFIVFLFSLSFHEAAHAFVSNKFGDDTGKMLGRISLNPVVHIHPIGTVLFPLISAFTGIPLFGWAKPVPVNPLNWRDKDLANIMTSAAGPLSNFLLATIFFVILKSLLMTGVAVLNVQARTPYQIFTGDGIMEPIVILVTIGLFVNLALGVFNLFPIPPLDGSHVLESLLTGDARAAYEQIEPYSIFLFVALLYFGIFGMVFSPIMQYTLRLLI